MKSNRKVEPPKDRGTGGAATAIVFAVGLAEPKQRHRRHHREARSTGATAGPVTASGHARRSSSTPAPTPSPSKSPANLHRPLPSGPAGPSLPVVGSFPAARVDNSLRRHVGKSGLNHWCGATIQRVRGAKSQRALKFPANSLRAGKWRGGDRFAVDCLHHHAFREPPVRRSAENSRVFRVLDGGTPADCRSGEPNAVSAAALTRRLCRQKRASWWATGARALVVSSPR